MPAGGGLSEQEVYLWAVNLDCPPRWSPALLECLFQDERARAERFRFDRDRRRFVGARAALRVILASYLGLPAHAIAFEYGLFGKPALANDTTGEIELNLSHCQALALIAVLPELLRGGSRSGSFPRRRSRH